MAGSSGASPLPITSVRQEGLLWSGTRTSSRETSGYLESEYIVPPKAWKDLPFLFDHITFQTGDRYEKLPLRSFPDSVDVARLAVLIEQPSPSSISAEGLARRQGYQPGLPVRGNSVSMTPSRMCRTASQLATKVQYPAVNPSRAREQTAKPSLLLSGKNPPEPSGDLQEDGPLSAQRTPVGCWSGSGCHFPGSSLISPGLQPGPGGERVQDFLETGSSILRIPGQRGGKPSQK